MRYNVCTNLGADICPLTPLPRRARTKLDRVISQIDRAAPLKVRACEGTSEGSSAEVLYLDMPCAALIRRRKNQPLRLHLELEKILHSTCRAPMVLGGVEIVHTEGRISNVVRYSGDSNSCLLRRCGMDG